MGGAGGEFEGKSIGLSGNTGIGNLGAVNYCIGEDEFDGKSIAKSGSHPTRAPGRRPMFRLYSSYCMFLTELL